MDCVPVSPMVLVIFCTQLLCFYLCWGRLVSSTWLSFWVFICWAFTFLVLMCCISFCWHSGSCSGSLHNTFSLCPCYWCFVTAFYRLCLINKITMWCGYLISYLVNYVASIISPTILYIPFENNLRTEAIEQEVGRHEEKLLFRKVSAHVYSCCLLRST